MTFFAAKKLAAKIRPGFPSSLDGAPMLVPASTTSLGRALPQWCEKKGVRPKVIAEFDDSALMKTFGQDGVGVFCSPSVMEAEVKRQHGVQVVGRAGDIRERFYAISPERRLKNPAVVAICESAREELFAKR